MYSYSIFKQNIYNGTSSENDLNSLKVILIRTEYIPSRAHCLKTKMTLQNLFFLSPPVSSFAITSQNTPP